jgi:hypothetical protein
MAAKPVSASTAPAPGHLPRSRWGILYDVALQSIFQGLRTEEAVVASRVCRCWHANMARLPTRAQELLTVPQAAIRRCRIERALVESRSREPTIRPEVREKTIDTLDNRIHQLETRLRALQAPGAAAAAVEEIATIERRLTAYRYSRIPNSQIPRHILGKIAQYVDQPGRTIQFTSRPLPPPGVTTRTWKRHIGPTPQLEIPPALRARLSEPCPIFPGRKVEDTHILVDPRVQRNGRPVTFGEFIELAGRARGNPIRLNIGLRRILDELKDKPIPSEPYLLLKTCLSGTKSKNRAAQREVLAQHPQHREATNPEVVFAALMEYIQSGQSKTRLFYNEYARSSTELSNGWIVDFGGFGAGWPGIDFDGADDFAGDDFGLAVVLRGSS